MTTGLPAGRPWSTRLDRAATISLSPNFPSRHSHYEDLATRLAEAVLAGESGSFGILGTSLAQEVTPDTNREQAVAAARLVIAAENGCGSLQEFAAAATGAEVVVERSQLQAFEEFHANFAARLSADVTAAGQQDVLIEHLFTDQTTFGEYLLSIANGNAVFQMSADFLDEDFAVNVPVQVLHGIAPGRPVDRTASVEAWGSLLAGSLEALWSPLHRGTISVRECYLEPYGPLSFAPMYEVSLLFAYEASAGTKESGLKGMVEVCYPRISIVGAVADVIGAG